MAKQRMPTKSPRAGRDVSFDTVREILRECSGAIEGTSYGTPAFHVGKMLVVRLHQDGESLVVRIEPEQRPLLVRAHPETYSVTDHYLNYPLILVRMATIDRGELEELLRDACRLGDAIGHPKRRRQSLL